jgi:hypothetical protein
MSEILLHAGRSACTVPASWQAPHKMNLEYVQSASNPYVAVEPLMPKKAIHRAEKSRKSQSMRFRRCESEDFKATKAVGKIQSAGEESYEGLAKPRRPHHQPAACTDATRRLRREHRRTIWHISRSAPSPDNRTARP